MGIKRGEIYLIELPADGAAAGELPCIIIAENHSQGSVSVVPLSAAANEFSSQNVYVGSSELSQKIARCGHAFVVEKTRLKSGPICRLSSADLNQVHLGVLDEIQ